MVRACSLSYLRATQVVLQDTTFGQVIEGMLRTFRDKRFVYITAGEDVHGSVTSLLRYLTQAPPERFANATLEFHVHRPLCSDGTIYDPSSATQCMQSREELCGLVDVIKQKYSPWLSYIRVDVQPCKFRGKKVEVITCFDLLINVSTQRMRTDYAVDDGDKTRGGVTSGRQIAKWTMFEEWERSRR